MDEELIGRVTHYFGRIQVAAVEVSDHHVELGDTVRFLGSTSNFVQEVRSMEIDHEPVETAQIGDLVGIQVVDRVRPGDLVFRAMPR
jgi:putative protease